jgi:hypothetical protein
VIVANISDKIFCDAKAIATQIIPKDAKKGVNSIQKLDKIKIHNNIYETIFIMTVIKFIVVLSL